jgi:hypothetical protein
MGFHYGTVVRDTDDGDTAKMKHQWRDILTDIT